MPKPWFLTAQAETSLVEIALWTREHFGVRQAAVYEEEPIERCRAVASGAAASQSRRQIVDPGLPENLRFARAGQHFIVFVENEDKVGIVDFLHARSDLPAKLRTLADDGFPV